MRFDTVAVLTALALCAVVYAIGMATAPGWAWAVYLGLAAGLLRDVAGREVRR